MADARDVGVWTKHADEQVVSNPQPHKANKDYILRVWLDEVKPNNVIDYGCGGGLWHRLFDDYDYLGVDQNANMIKHAQERFGATHKFKQIQWDSPDIQNESTDLIFTSAVLQHNKHKDKTIVLEHFYRILKPNGYYMCTENTFRADNYKSTFPKIAEYRDDLDDGYTMTPKGWEIFMNNNGFKLVHFQPPGEYLWQKV